MLSGTEIASHLYFGGFQKERPSEEVCSDLDPLVELLLAMLKKQLVLLLHS